VSKVQALENEEVPRGSSEAFVELAPMQVAHPISTKFSFLGRKGSLSIKGSNADCHDLRL
jgi:hypothetical protein